MGAIRVWIVHCIYLGTEVKGTRVELNSAFGIREASRYNIESLFCVSL